MLYFHIKSATNMKVKKTFISESSTTVVFKCASQLKASAENRQLYVGADTQV